ncbi:histone acetyltransferase MCC1-like isoform X2 [Wolffia australiana]
MIESKIVYRPVRPTDLQALEQIHAGLFPIRYELEFFLNVVNGWGIVSWAAVDTNCCDGHEELVGFVTTRLVPAKETEIAGSFRYDSSGSEKTLVYILTLGVVEHYRNHGIATRLVQEVMKYALSVVSCAGIYLHVIFYNEPAIIFYRKMLFKLVKRLPNFYYIQSRHFDAYLFVYLLESPKSPCSPWGIVAAVAAFLKELAFSLAAALRKGGGGGVGKGRRRSDGKEMSSLLRAQDGVCGLV